VPVVPRPVSTTLIAVAVGITTNAAPVATTARLTIILVVVAVLLPVAGAQARRRIIQSVG